jgi:multiple sugar transport system permease protein
MQPTTTTSGGAWDASSEHISPQRKTAGRAVIWGATAILAVAVARQALHAAGRIDSGFASWQPVLWIYLAWAVALGVGLVVSRGERGHRAVFVLPAVLFTVSMVVFPTVFGLYVAFTDWNLSSSTGRVFSGLDNLRKLFRDGFFWNAMLNMGWYLLAVLVQYAISFGLALLLAADIRARKFFRVVFLMPFMLSPVAVSWMIGKSMLDAQNGPIADLLRVLGVANPAFYDTAWKARFAIMAMDAWIWVPFGMVLLLAALQALPGEVMESAKVDGASHWQSFWHMTFPLMLPASVTAVVLRVIFELKIADLILQVTGGAPGGASDSVSSYIVREYRERSNVGYGTMLAQFYLVAIIIFVSVLLWAIGKWMRKVT